MNQELKSDQLMRSMRQSEVLYRERTVFDMQGVFMNSAYGVGLVGLGWVAIKLGRMIQTAQDVVSGEVVKTFIATAEYNSLFDWVEGKYKDVPLESVRQALTPENRVLIEDFRANSYLWEDYKAQYMVDSPVRDAVEAAKPAEIKILDIIDGAYGRFGPIMPFGVVSANVLLEAIRIRRLKGEVEV